MDISLAQLNACDALLYIGSSPGADREKNWMLQHNKPVFISLEEIEKILP